MDLLEKYEDITYGDNVLSCFGEITSRQREGMLKIDKLGEYKNIDPQDQLSLEEEDYKRIIKKMDCGTYSNDFVVTLEGRIYILVNVESALEASENNRPILMRYIGKLTEVQNLQYINELMYIREVVQEVKAGQQEKKVEETKIEEKKKSRDSRLLINAIIYILLFVFVCAEGFLTKDSGKVALILMMWFAYKLALEDDLANNKKAKIVLLVQACFLVIGYLLACLVSNFYSISTITGGVIK